MGLMKVRSSRVIQTLRVMNVGVGVPSAIAGLSMYLLSAVVQTVAGIIEFCHLIRRSVVDEDTGCHCRLCCRISSSPRGFAGDCPTRGLVAPSPTFQCPLSSSNPDVRRAPQSVLLDHGVETYQGRRKPYQRTNHKTPLPLRSAQPECTLCTCARGIGPSRSMPQVR